MKVKRKGSEAPIMRCAEKPVSVRQFTSELRTGVRKVLEIGPIARREDVSSLLTLLIPPADREAEIQSFEQEDAYGGREYGRILTSVTGEGGRGQNQTHLRLRIEAASGAVFNPYDQLPLEELYVAYMELVALYREWGDKEEVGKHLAVARMIAERIEKEK